MKKFVFHISGTDFDVSAATNDEGLGLWINGKPVLSEQQFSVATLLRPDIKIRRYLTILNLFGDNDNSSRYRKIRKHLFGGTGDYSEIPSGPGWQEKLQERGRQTVAEIRKARKAERDRIQSENDQLRDENSELRTTCEQLLPLLKVDKPRKHKKERPQDVDVSEDDPLYLEGYFDGMNPLIKDMPKSHPYYAKGFLEGRSELVGSKGLLINEYNSATTVHPDVKAEITARAGKRHTLLEAKLLEAAKRGEKN